MRIDGTLKTWDDSRGFGFITPRNGGQDIFIHISEYPRQGGKPRIGEPLTFEIALNAEGKKKAVKVRRPESMRARTPAASARPGNDGTSLWGRIVPAVVIAVMLGAGYKHFAPRLLAGTPEAAQPLAEVPNPLNPSNAVLRGQSAPRQLADTPEAAQPLAEPPSADRRVQAAADAGQWRCDGRQHCSQMTSCEEAKFFLRNCPGVMMDGDHDGIPCEDRPCDHDGNPREDGFSRH